MMSNSYESNIDTSLVKRAETIAGTSVKIKLLPKNERPRERLIMNGPSSLTNSELLAILLGKGIKNVSVAVLAQKILYMLGDISNLSKIKIIDFL